MALLSLAHIQGATAGGIRSAFGHRVTCQATLEALFPREVRVAYQATSQAMFLRTPKVRYTQAMCRLTRHIQPPNRRLHQAIHRTSITMRSIGFVRRCRNNTRLSSGWPFSVPSCQWSPGQPFAFATRLPLGAFNGTSWQVFP